MILFFPLQPLLGKVLAALLGSEILYPVSTTTAGSWTATGVKGATLWNTIDEVSASDTDYDYSNLAGGGTDSMTLGLTNPSTVVGGGARYAIFNVRHEVDNLGDNPSIVYRLIEGVTVHASYNPTTALVFTSYTSSKLGPFTVTDPDNLELKVDISADDTTQFDVSWANVTLSDS